jgi:hypothetical protein
MGKNFKVKKAAAKVAVPAVAETPKVETPVVVAAVAAPVETKTKKAPMHGSVGNWQKRILLARSCARMGILFNDFPQGAVQQGTLKELQALCATELKRLHEAKVKVPGDVVLQAQVLASLSGMFGRASKESPMGKVVPQYRRHLARLLVEKAPKSVVDGLTKAGEKAVELTGGKGFKPVTAAEAGIDW